MLYGQDDIQAFEEAQPLSEDFIVFYDSDGEHVFEIPKTLGLTDEQIESVRQIVTMVANKYYDNGFATGREDKRKQILCALGLNH